MWNIFNNNGLIFSNDKRNYIATNVDGWVVSKQCKYNKLILLIIYVNMSCLSPKVNGAHWASKVNVKLSTGNAFVDRVGFWIVYIWICWTWTWWGRLINFEHMKIRGMCQLSSLSNEGFMASHYLTHYRMGKDSHFLSIYFVFCSWYAF